MNFLSKTLSSFSINSIPYTFKDKVIDSSSNSNVIDQNSIWNLYDGLNPKDSAKVSIFEFNLKDTANLQKRTDSLARNAFKKLKLIKFPGVISIIDFIENDNYLYIITEPVVPLLAYLRDNQHDNGISQDTKLFGIHSIAKSLQFLNMTCNCLHGNINLCNSVFVNELGDWKLFGFELLTNLQSDPDQPIYRLSNTMPGFNDVQSSEVQSSGIEGIRAFPIKFDSYKFGMFAYNILVEPDFNSITFNNNVVEQSKFANKTVIPLKLSNALKKLLSPNINLRITVEKFNQETESFLNANTVIEFNKQLEEIKFKNESEKLDFFKYELSTYVSDLEGDNSKNTFPPGLLDHKLLPELIGQYGNISKLKPTVDTTPAEIQQRQETIAVILNYILKFGVKLPTDMFNKLVKPVIMETFGLADRSVRLILLEHLASYEIFLTEADVQLKIFYNLISGFQDTNFMIRENTLKSITTIIDKVSVKQVNQDLLKVLAKSQMDPKPSIRVNTLILIIKISSKIYKTSKNNVLITALSKSLRDTFTPCKMMALSGFANLIEDFSLEEICSKILGHLAISLMDNKSSKVRVEAKRVFELYLQSVESHASTLPDDEDDIDAEEAEFFKNNTPKTENSTPLEDNGASVGGSLLKFSFLWSGKPEVGGALNNDFNSSTPDLTRVATPTSEPLNPIGSKSNTHKDNSWDGMDDDFDDGWAMNDDEVEIVKPLSATSKVPLVLKPLNKPKSTLNSNARKSGSLKLGRKPAAKQPGSTLKLNLVGDDNEVDGWGDDSVW
jgi:SCY1-like protein 1